MADVIRLVELREQPLLVQDVYDAVVSARTGGSCVFVGTVRDHDGGQSVSRLEYVAHPSALDQMRSTADGVADRYPVEALALVHRVGTLAIGDVAVVAAVACAHRQEAFAACHDLIDDLKAQVPIWKHQQFADGTDQWVGTP